MTWLRDRLLLWKWTLTTDWTLFVVWLHLVHVSFWFFLLPLEEQEAMLSELGPREMSIPELRREMWRMFMGKTK